MVPSSFQVPSVMPSDGIRGKGHELKHRKFYLNMKKISLTLRVTEHWNRVHGEVVESSPLETSKIDPDTLLWNLL